MEQINSSGVSGSNSKFFQKSVSQKANEIERQKCDKNIQGIVSNTELSKKDSDSMKNLVSLDKHEAESGVVSYEKKESCNKPEEKDDNLNLENQKRLKNENAELKNRIDDLGKRIVFLENQLSQKDKKISGLEDKVIALKGRIAGLDACICELNGELSTYNPLPGVRAILCNAGKFVDGSLKKNAVNEMKFLLGREIRYEDDDLKELTTKISRILKNELLIDGLDSNFDSNGNLKKEAVDAIKAIVNKVYPYDKID